MTLTRRDLAATGATILAILTFLAVHEGWNVPLVGDSVRWASAVVLLLGSVGCALGSTARSGSAKICAPLGVLALVLGVFAIVFGSLTLLSLLVVDIVALWAIATFGHVRRHAPHKPLTT